MVTGQKPLLARSPVFGRSVSLAEGVAWDWRPAPEEARRHRIQLHWDGTELGYFQRHSHTLVPVAACPLVTV